MNVGEGESTTRTVIEALKIIRQRAVLLKGWGELHAEDLPDSVHVVETVPHEWLFPQMSCIVHHGGAGTTGAASRSGVPQVVVPHFADQPFWATRVHKIGIAPKPIYMNKLNAEDLAQAINFAITDKEINSQSESLGVKIRTEDGIARAVEIVNSYFEKGIEHVI
jgi:UDP:flavonoid glycosyltransferase YjiC (YdhE family)